MRPLVVLPTYNEAENIETVIKKLRDSVKGVSILVVDDNSTDGTSEKVKKLAEGLGDIYMISRPGKMGLGSAYLTGFKWGLERDFDYFFEMDSDLSHDPASINDFLEAFSKGYDVVIGSRYVPGGAIPSWSLMRLFLSKGGNIFASIMLGIKVKDATSGFRGYNREFLEKLDFGKITAEGYGFQIEMVYQAKKLGAKIIEVPISFVDRVKGKSKMSGKIVAEAFYLVTKWAIGDRIMRRH
jgi:dolichol-phosphate mannosyltransferase